MTCTRRPLVAEGVNSRRGRYSKNGRRNQRLRQREKSLRIARSIFAALTISIAGLLLLYVETRSPDPGAEAVDRAPSPIIDDSITPFVDNGIPNSDVEPSETPVAQTESSHPHDSPLPALREQQPRFCGNLTKEDPTSASGSVLRSLQDIQETGRLEWDGSAQNLPGGPVDVWLSVTPSTHRR